MARALNLHLGTLFLTQSFLLMPLIWGCTKPFKKTQDIDFQTEPRPRARVIYLYQQEQSSITLQDFIRRKSEGGQGYAGIIMHIFTTWCRPCLEEVNSLNLLQQQAPHIKVIGVCVEGRSCPRLEDFKRLTHASYELYVADASLVRGDGPYGSIPSVPVTYLMDSKGRQVIRFDGHIPLTYATKLTVPLSPLAEPSVEESEEDSAR